MSFSVCFLKKGKTICKAQISVGENTAKALFAHCSVGCFFRMSPLKDLFPESSGMPYACRALCFSGGSESGSKLVLPSLSSFETQGCRESGLWPSFARHFQFWWYFRCFTWDKPSSAGACLSLLTTEMAKVISLG